MEAVGGPDAKKARWSPTSFGPNNGNGAGANASASGLNRGDAFANYGYGPQAGLSQQQNGFNGNSPSAGFNGNALYSTPTLSLNTAVASNGMSQQMSPNTAGPYTPQSQQPPSANPNSANPYNGFNGYNMLGMGLPTMGVLGGFAYNGQMAANFAQVSVSVAFTLCICLLVLAAIPRYGCKLDAVRVVLHRFLGNVPAPLQFSRTLQSSVSLSVPSRLALPSLAALAAGSAQKVLLRWRADYVKRSQLCRLQQKHQRDRPPVGWAAGARDL